VLAEQFLDLPAIQKLKAEEQERLGVPTGIRLGLSRDVKLFLFVWPYECLFAFFFVFYSV
jgi:hypothetical protein